MLRAALIDVGGTLWRNHGPPTDDYEIRQLCALLGCDQDRALELRTSLYAPELYDRYLTGGQDTDALVAEVMREHRIDGIDPVLLRRAMPVPASEGRFPPFDGADRLLATVRELGLSCVIVSNTFWRDAEDYWKDFEHLGVSSYIDSIITSLDAKSQKPHDAIFEAAIEAAGCEPGECVFLGDMEEKDIVPAANRGMRTILVAIEQPPPRETAADTVVTDLAEAERTLREWAVQ